MKNQKGFAAIEALLIAVAVIIVGGTGYYVYHANQAANKNYKAATAAASNTPSKQANGGKGGEGDAHAQTGPAKTEVYIIHEWNVAATIPTPPATAGLIQYKLMQQGGEVWAQFSTQELKDADPACAVENEPAAGLIVRAQATDHTYLDDGTDTGHTVQQDITSGAIKTYKKVGNYYYWYEHPRAVCGNSAKVSQLQQAAIKEVQLIANKLAAE